MGFAVSTTVTGPDDAVRFVAERVAEGSDYIKILVEDPKLPGTKAPGHRADLVLVDGDPTQTISATRNIRGVWIGGYRVR